MRLSAAGPVTHKAVLPSPTLIGEDIVVDGGDVFVIGTCSDPGGENKTGLLFAKLDTSLGLVTSRCEWGATAPNSVAVTSAGNEDSYMLVVRQ